MCVVVVVVVVIIVVSHGTEQIVTARSHAKTHTDEGAHSALMSGNNIGLHALCLSLMYILQHSIRHPRNIHIDVDQPPE